MPDPTPVVAERDGKAGCPEIVWLDGIYRTRCGFGIDECHRHGPFATTPPALPAPVETPEQQP